MRLTDAEWNIMNALWEGHPATARDISERLSPDLAWAYTTVKTLLARLLEKGAVSERKRANTSVYEPLLTRENARRGALTALAHQAFQGAYGPLALFLIEDRKLSTRERRALIEMLKKHDRSEGRDEP